MKEDLTTRELQVAELIAWGANRKEVPDLLSMMYGGKVISINTVNNIISNIYAKLSLNSETELSAWYFCNYEEVDSSHAPGARLRSTIYSIIFLCILIPQLTDVDQMLRPQRARVREKTENVRSGRSGRGRRHDEILLGT